MTQEEKQLLLKDLCARLLHEVKIHINSCIEEQNQMQLFDVNIEAETIGVRNEKWTFRAIPIIDDEDETKVIKPYLRPMSSITEEDIHSLFNAMYPDISMMWYEKETDLIRFRAADYNNKRFLHITLWFNKIYSLKQIDWLNAHHFDYRGLIEKGLALEAPEGMYECIKTE